MSEGMDKVKVRLYQFYNYDVSKSGEPFALCDECLKTQPVPQNCDLRKIANDAVCSCEECGAKSASERHP